MTIDPFWQRPWSHLQAWLLVGGAFAVAWTVQILHPTLALQLPDRPWNWLVAGAPAILALIAGRGWAAHPALAISGLLAVAAATWPIAVYPVGASAPAWLHRLGLGDPLSAPTFAGALLIVIVNLAVALGRRWSATVTATRSERLRFSILHLGLLIAVVGGVASHGGLVRARFSLEEKAVPGVVAQREGGGEVVLPFALALDDFVLDRFPPMLVLAGRDGALHRGEALLGPGVEDQLRGLAVQVDVFLPTAAVVGAAAVPFADPAANPAARVTVRDAAGVPCAAGWLYPGGPLGPPLSLALPDGRKLHLETPRPRRFLARVRAISPDGRQQASEITVNQPLRRDGWAVYILSYDEALGPASTSAVFEVVEDRALPVVYLGLILVLIGVSWHLWSPRPAGAAP